MTFDDPLMEALADLPDFARDPDRESAVLARCHEQLRRRAEKRARAETRKAIAGRLLEAASALGLLAYLASVLEVAFKLTARH